MTSPAQPVMEAWRFATRAVLLAVCVGTFIVTLTTLAVRIRQVGFLGGADAVGAAPPPAPPPMTAEDSARAAHPFSRIIPNDPAPPGVDTRSPLANGLLLGALAGVFATVITAWNVLAPLPALYRRGALSMTSAIGTLIGMMLTVPFDVALQQPGLILFAGLLATAAWRLRKAITGVTVVEAAPAA